MPTDPRTPDLSTEPTRRNLRALPIVVAVVGVLSSIGTWRLMATLEDEYVASRFRHDAAERFIAVEAEVQESLRVLALLSALDAARPDIDADSFRRIAAPILEHYPWVHALGWNPRVLGSERAEHEARSSASGGSPYEITERVTQGRMQRAAERDEYVVVRFIEPLLGNEAAHGFDVKSEPKRNAALVEACETGKTTATAAITLVQERDASERAFLAFEPIWFEGMPAKVAERREQIDGYIVGVFRIGDLVETALAGFDPVALQWTLVEEGAAAGEPPLYERAAGGSPPVDPVLRRVSSLAVGGRTWRVEAVPTLAYLAGFRTKAPLGALLAGLVITGLLTSYLDLLRRRTARVVALVAEREDARAALQASLDRHRTTLDSIADGGWDWNLVTEELLVSERWKSSMGYSSKDLTATDSFLTLVHPGDVESMRSALDAHLEGRSPIFEVDCRLRLASGRHRWFRRRGKVVERGANGEPMRMVGADTDVTEKRRAAQEQADLEHQVQHAQKLESLGVLAGGIAHDFNNLLQVVLGNLELARERGRCGESPESELEQIHGAASRATELVSQMLAYAGKGQTVCERIDVAILLRDMSELLRSAISKKAELRFSLVPGTATVDGDPSQLRQVFMNLLINASDALGDDTGVIEVRAFPQTADRALLDSMLLGTSLLPGPFVHIEVADTGLGMTADTCANVFEPFFTTKFQGRGLGLAATLGIVRAHGGAVRVVSELGVGTTFQLLLPAAAERDAAAEEVAPAEPEAPVAGPTHAAGERRATVLVVDDEEAVVEIACTLLERSGFATLRAPNGVEAVELFRQMSDSIDLVLLDLTMPRLRGREAFLAISQLNPDVPVVLASAYSREATVQDLDGVAGFIRKPFQVGDLVRTVEATLRS